MQCYFVLNVDIFINRAWTSKIDTVRQNSLKHREVTELHKFTEIQNSLSRSTSWTAFWYTRMQRHRAWHPQYSESACAKKGTWNESVRGFILHWGHWWININYSRDSKFSLSPYAQSWAEFSRDTLRNCMYIPTLPRNNSPPVVRKAK